MTGVGDTLQALRAHRMVDPLGEPGECDLTAHVDFAAMARSARARRRGRPWPDRPGRLPARARRRRREPRRSASGPARPRAEEFEVARQRLVGKGEGEMGALFKAMAIANRALPPPPGFQPLAAKPA